MSDSRHPLIAENVVSDAADASTFLLPTGTVTFLLTDVEHSTASMGGGARGDGEGDQPPLRDPGRCGRIASWCSAGRAGGGRQHRGRVQSRRRCGRRRAERAAAARAGEVARGRRPARPNGAPHWRRPTSRRVQLLRPDGDPHRPAASSRPWRADHRVTSNARPRRRRTASRHIVARSRKSPAQGPRSARAGLPALPPRPARQLPRARGPGRDAEQPAGAADDIRRP